MSNQADEELVCQLPYLTPSLTRCGFMCSISDFALSFFEREQLGYCFTSSCYRFADNSDKIVCVETI